MPKAHRNEKFEMNSAERAWNIFFSEVFSTVPEFVLMTTKGR
jgi:hypothetical protein